MINEIDLERLMVSKGSEIQFQDFVFGLGEMKPFSAQQSTQP